MKDKDNKLKKLMDAIEEFLGEKKPKSEESKEHSKENKESEPKKSSDEDKKQLVDAIDKVVKGENPAVLLFASESKDGDLENSAALIRGERVSVLAMMSAVVHKTLKEAKIPNKLFAEALDDWEKIRSE